MKQLELVDVLWLEEEEEDILESELDNDDIYNDNHEQIHVNGIGIIDGEKNCYILHGISQYTIFCHWHKFFDLFLYESI